MNHPLLAVARRAACLGLALSLAPGALVAQATNAPGQKNSDTEPAKLAGANLVAADTRNPEKSGPAVLEPFKVTGSHVARVDYETPSPVLTFTATEIEDKGYATLGEFVSNLSFNNNQTNSEITVGSFVTGAGTSNPRGLGSNRVLTLINGRRGVPHALTNGINGTPVSVFNFNSVPFGAIDHVEFLKDGASAIYGSDAITGVYNIILKKNYSGAIVDLNVSNSPHHDMLNRRVSVTAGAARNGWQIFASLSHRAQHASYIQDYGTHSTFFGYMGGKGTDQFSTTNNPSYVTLTAAQATAAGFERAGIYVIPNAVRTANPRKSDFVFVGTATTAIPRANRFDFGPVTQLQPANETAAGYVTLERKLTGRITAFSSVSLTRSNTYYNFGPFGHNTSLNGLTLTADNPYNPFGIPLTAGAATPVAFTLRTDNNTNQRRQAYSQSTSLLLGVRGTTTKTWEWESAVSYGVNRAARYTDYFPSDALRRVLAGTTRATAFNPFGPSDNPNLLRDILVRVPERNNMVDVFTYDLSTAGRPWKIPLRGAGELGVATGYEYREEDLLGRPDTSTNYISFTPNQQFHGRRHVNAAYVEFSVPLQRWLELQLAGRHEYYSDFGHTTKPKYSAKLALPKNKFVNVLVRGSFSQSFKAPDLGQTHQARTIASTTLSSDPFRPGEGARTVRVIQGGNPELQPEQGKVQYLGFVFEIPALKGLSLTADYIDIKIRGAIGTLTQAYLLSPEGQAQFPNAITRGPNLATDPPGWPGPVTEYKGISENLGFQLSRTWDFGVRYTFRTQSRGTLTFNSDVTQLVKRGTDSGLGAGFSNSTGRYNAPVWRCNHGLSWRYRNFTTSVTADVIGKFWNNGFTAGRWGENVFTLINTSVSYRGFKGYTLSLGANNALNKRPPQNGYTDFGFDERGVDAVGANGIVLNCRVRREF